MTDKSSIGKFPIAMLALIFLAAGCSVGPNYERPDLPVPATWTEAQQKGVAARAIELTRWWTKFNDPTLVERAPNQPRPRLEAHREARIANLPRRRLADGGCFGSCTRNRASENA
jgi:outer membrane protein TolC